MHLPSVPPLGAKRRHGSVRECQSSKTIPALCKFPNAMSTISKGSQRRISSYWCIKVGSWRLSDSREDYVIVLIVPESSSKQKPHSFTHIALFAVQDRKYEHVIEHNFNNNISTRPFQSRCMSICLSGISGVPSCVYRWICLVAARQQSPYPDTSYDWSCLYNHLI